MDTASTAKLTAAAVLALSGTALSEVLVAPIGGRLEVFEIADPDAEVGEARRLDAPRSAVRRGRLALLDGARPRELGVWSLTSRVLVEAPDADAARASVGGAGEVVPMADLSGWFAVEAPGVGAAAELALRLIDSPGIGRVELDAYAPIALRSIPDDPLFGQQWHLRNTLYPSRDVNAEAAWDAGFTGAGVTICIVESFGFQTAHPDLAPNVNTSATPPTQFVSSHMTAVAGIAAAAGNNGLGVTGLAYGADLTQALIGSNQQIASALLLLNDINDVKNNSWGPLDTGTLDPLPAVVADALEVSIATGRGELGEIFVWAGGNGAGSRDRVDYDPYASSRYTIAVAAVGDDDRQADYSEPGSSLLVSAYSNGGNRGITTTTSGGGFTNSFGGTSAASPLVAGVVGLMLEANPQLTWRDVQHVLVESARPIDPGDEGWTTNGAGKPVNEAYGFGMVDAGEAVTLARSWSNVAPEESYVSGVVAVGEALPDGSSEGLLRTLFVDESITIESVELIVNAETSFVGEIELELISPDGTRSPLSRSRFTDSQDDLVDRLFTSTRHWGENSTGTWAVRMADARIGNEAVWQDFELRIHGTPGGPGACSPADVAAPYGILDLADSNAFATAYLSGEPSADLAAPAGVFDEQDINAFVQQFAAGCP